MKKIVLTYGLYIILISILNAQQQTDTVRIFFAIDQSVVDDNNASALNALIDNKSVSSISIYGYADFLGAAEYNQQLSAKRSAGAHNYLMNKGICSEKFAIIKGEGIHPNSLEANRRDIEDKGIQAHRMVQIVYTYSLPNVMPAEPDFEVIIPSQEPTKTLSEENLAVNNHIVLENILFFNASDEFLPESYPALQELLMFMRNHRTLKIEIHGHICCQSDELDELYIDDIPMSLYRAKAVYDYLIRNGVSPNRISYKGFGATKKRFPLEQNEYEKYMNRRVEILILEI